ncbi:restriction endonuclease subunit S [Vibrio alginolyticus]|uniref:restriction endonuclease subunit S n=1 Tax=Vibrio TaxID=662 RepID=UPI00193C2A6B|nr:MULTISPECIES: restriction endonuclease subunit S [Vibrio]MBT0110058.1 restriction endonuclease subunit S [Vibrio alginolyticus]
MTGRYKAYSEYKLSSNYALGYIPSHWDTSKVRYLSYCLDGKRIPLNGTERGEMQGLIPYWGANSVVDYIDEYIFDEDLILLGEDGAPFFDTTRNVAFFVQGKVWPNNHVHVLRPEISKVNAKFLTYALNCVDYHLYITGSTRDKLNQAAMNDIALRICSLQEQQKIANFLDHETAKIDTLIDKQEKLIELLKEKRQAVISQAVTKGLNPDAPMKNSGVEWLGEVPEHWTVSKLKWKAQTTSGGTPSTAKYEVYYEGGDIPWIRTTDLNNGKLFVTPVSITAKALEDTACSILPKDSLLLAMYGGAGSIGKHSLLMFEATINQAVCGIYPSNSFEPEFLHYFYEFYRPFWMINAAGTRKDPNIGQDHIKEGKVALPPKEEQRAIVAYVNKTLDLLNTLNDKATEAIELAKERKAALISAAVTGQIDVRDWKPAESNLVEVD